MIINVITILHDSPNHRKLLSSAESLLVTTKITYIIICFVLSGGIRTTNIIMYVHSSQSIEYEVASVESKRRAGLYISSALASDAGSPQPVCYKTKCAQLHVLLASRTGSFLRLNVIHLTIMITSCYVLRCSPWLSFPYGRSLPPLWPPEGGP